MKKILFTFTCVFAVFSCTGIVPIQVEPKPVAIFSASCEGHTKVTIDESFVLCWEKGDEILVSNGTKSNVFVAGNSGTSVDFTAVGMIISETAAYSAVFPAELAAFDAGKVTVSVPDNYEAVPGVYPQSPAVAVSDGTSRHFEFRNLCALVSFEVTGNDVKSLVFEGLDGETLAGKIAVNDFSTCDFTVADGRTSVTLSSVRKMTPGRYYVTLLPQTFEKGIKVTIVKTDDSSVTREYDPFSLERSMYIDLEKLDEGRFLRYVIKDASDLQAFCDDAPLCESYVTAFLADDIDLDGVLLRPASSYKGRFDGDGHSLNRWHSDAPLFRTVEEGAVIENLHIGLNCSFTTGPGGFSALIAGVNRGRISACVNNADITGAVNDVKGLVGGIAAVSFGSVENCVNRGVLTVEGTPCGVGGIVGGYYSLEGGTALSGCRNEGSISLTGNIKFAGGIAAIGKGGIIRSCSNEGALTMAAGQVDSLIAGGVAGRIDGSLENCVNSGDVSVSGKAFTLASLGGVTGMCVGTSGNILTCSQSGSVTVGVESPQVNAGGIAGWSSLPVGSGSRNEGRISVGENASGKVYAGGVIGQSTSTFNTVYNNGDVTVCVGATSGQVMLGGVAGYMNNSSLPSKSLVTGQNNGTVKLSGGIGNESTDIFYAAGVVGNTTVPNVSHSNTTWATCNTNHGQIEVDVPLTVYVGGIFGRVTGTGVAATTLNVSGAKNDGSIQVSSPGMNSCVGGIVGRHGRGALGNANGFGLAAKPASIVVTGADESVSVGAYAGYVSTDNGGNYPGCVLYVSGFSCYGSIQAEGATAGVLIGRAAMTGNSTSNGIMLGTSNSERPKISSEFVLNGVKIDDPSSDVFNVNTFFGKIIPSSTSTKLKTDGTPLKNKYYFCTAKETAEVSYIEGILKI